MRNLTSLAGGRPTVPVAGSVGGAFLLLAHAARDRRMLPPLPRVRDELLQEMGR